MYSQFFCKCSLNEVQSNHDNQSVNQPAHVIHTQCATFFPCANLWKINRIPKWEPFNWWINIFKINLCVMCTTAEKIFHFNWCIFAGPNDKLYFELTPVNCCCHSSFLFRIKWQSQCQMINFFQFEKHSHMQIYHSNRSDGRKWIFSLWHGCWKVFGKSFSMYTNIAFMNSIARGNSCKFRYLSDFFLSNILLL